MLLTEPSALHTQGGIYAAGPPVAAVPTMTHQLVTHFHLEEVT